MTETSTVSRFQPLIELNQHFKLFVFPLTFLQNVNFPRLKNKFPEHFLALKYFFSPTIPDLWQPCPLNHYNSPQMKQTLSLSTYSVMTGPKRNSFVSPRPSIFPKEKQRGILRSSHFGFF